MVSARLASTRRKPSSAGSRRSSGTVGELDAAPQVVTRGRGGRGGDVGVHRFHPEPRPAG